MCLKNKSSSPSPRQSSLFITNMESKFSSYLYLTSLALAEYFTFIIFVLYSSPSEQMPQINAPCLIYSILREKRNQKNNLYLQEKGKKNSINGEKDTMCLVLNCLDNNVTSVRQVEMSSSEEQYDVKMKTDGNG